MLFIAKHCTEISSRCFQMYSAPCSVCLYSAISPWPVFFPDLSLLHFVPKAVASFSIPFRGARTVRAMRGHGCVAMGVCAPTLFGGWRSPRDGRACVGRGSWDVCSYGTAEAAAGCSAGLQLPASSWKTARSSGSGCRNEAEWLKCTVKWVRQGSRMLLP